MTRNDELEAQLQTSIAALAKEAADVENYGPSICADFALAALRLAEASAWMRNAAQPHGGSAAASR